MKYRELTEKIIGCAYRVYNQIYYGFLGLIVNGKQGILMRIYRMSFDVLILNILLILSKKSL